MYLLYADETNLDPRTEFFVYGGIAIPGERVLSFSREVDEVRRASGVDPLFQLKFNPSPPNLDHEKFKALKQRILELAAEHDCELLVAIVMHAIAGDPAIARRFNLNIVLYHFDCLMNHLDSHGLVLIDRFADDQIDDQLRERFAVGVTDMPFSKKLPLERIVGIHYSAIGQSHLCSLIDIAIGSLRYAVNCFSKGEADRATVLLDVLNPLFYRSTEGGNVSKLSIAFSPNAVKSDRYRQRYEQLHEFLSGHGLVPDQRILSVREY